MQPTEATESLRMRKKRRGNSRSCMKQQKVGIWLDFSKNKCRSYYLELVKDKLYSIL